MINPSFLNTFIYLAEYQSFIETAKKLNMTQPGVSQHLAKLEEYFDVSLVTRKGKSFELTQPGEKLRTYAKNLLQSHNKFCEQISLDNPKEGYCKFATGNSIFNEFDTFLANFFFFQNNVCKSRNFSHSL